MGNHRHVITRTRPSLSLKQRTWHSSLPIALKVLPEVSSSDVVIILSWAASPLSHPMSTLVTHQLLRKLNISSTSLLVSLLYLELFSSSLLSSLVTIGSRLSFFSSESLSPMHPKVYSPPSLYA